MKKSIFLLVVMLLSLVSYAETVEVNNIFYVIIPKGEVAEVTKNPDSFGYMDEVIIPNSINYNGVDYRVTSIGAYAFASSRWLTSVTIPNSITSIGESAFSSCSRLTSINIPNTVTAISDYSFYDCSSLTSITIPNTVTSIGNSAFKNCNSLTSINIPNAVTTIGDTAFMNCYNITSITIPNTIVSIGENTFRNCSRLTSINIPNTVTAIGQFSFADCSSLTSINIPNTVRTIGKSAFSGCTSVTIINISNSITTISDYTFADCSSLTSINIPNGIISIGNYAFRNCSSLTTITMPQSVNRIQKDAFVNCTQLSDVFCYAEKAPYTESGAFTGSYIEYVTLHVQAASIENYSNTAPWSDFGNIVSIEGTSPETPKCNTPIIYYENGQLMMSCDTEGAEFVTEITDEDVKKHYDATIILSKAYAISVYATKAGYDNSDIVTATLCWIEAEPTNVGITTGVNEIPSHAVLIQNNGGNLSINGAIEGKAISVYNLSGQLLGSATATSGTTTINTSLSAGETCIVKIGDKSVKVLLR